MMIPRLREWSMTDIRRPAVAGLFYPFEAACLRPMLTTLLQDADVRPLAHARAIIAPHAGYVCSGGVAAHSFKALRMLPDLPYTVYLLGPTHWRPVFGVGLSSASGFETPLGTIPVAQDAVEQLLALGEPYALVDAAHAPEHCLEVQLPFLQMVLADFQIVPMLLDEEADPIQVGADLAAIATADPQALFVISSDLSHYYPCEQATAVDRTFLRAIVDGALPCVAAGRACGRVAILSLMVAAARLGWRARQLAYGNSADTCGSRNSVVGYGAVAYVEEQ